MPAPGEADGGHDTREVAPKATVKLRVSLSARRPGELAPAEHVEVQMHHRLAGLIAVVDHQPEVVADPALTRDLADRLQQAAAKRLIVEVREPLDVLPGHDEDVEWGAGEDVVDGYDVVVLVDHGRGDLAGHDATEQAVVHAAKRIPTCR